MSAREAFMREALLEAAKARETDEVPVGAVIVKDGRVIARAHNMTEALADATAHAEMLALREAERVLGSWRLTGCTLYATLEPCAMCAGAAVNCRVDAIVFGAFDGAAGCCASVAELTEGWLPHRIRTVGGVLEAECAAQLSEYFKAKR